MHFSSLNATDHRSLIVAKRTKEYKEKILEIVKNNGKEVSSKQLRQHFKSHHLPTLLTELVREGQLKRKRGFDAFGRVCIVYAFREKVK